MSVEEKFGKVLGTWFTKTDKITDNLIYMISAFMKLQGNIKNGLDSLIEITKWMFNYLKEKKVSEEKLRKILVTYSILIIFSIRYNLGTGCKKFKH